MAYFDADMDAEQTPVIDRMDTEYTIYVNNLPSELNEDAIRQVFGEYGKIIGMFHPRNATWTYITYGTYREAESAIRELNDKSPLYLKVALAKERSSMNEGLQTLHVPETFREGPQIRSATTPTVFTQKDTKHQQSMGRGRPLHAVHRHARMPQMILPCSSIESGSLPSSAFSQTSNIYEVEEPFVNTNRLWTRGMITVTADGKRHVSLGRGYTFYEFPEQDPKIEEYITKVYEQRHNGLYEYAVDKFKNEVCIVCSAKTTKHCEKCYTYYCSRVCQVKDWRRHQTECERIPALVEETVNDMSSLQISKDENQTKKVPTPNVSKTIASNDVKLRRPNVTQAENSNSTSTNNLYKNDTDFTYQCSTNSSSTSNQNSSAQHDDTNIPQIKRVDQLGINAMNIKDFSQQNRLRRYNHTNGDTDQLRRNDGYSSFNSTNQSNYNRNSNGAISKTTTNKERFDNSNVRGRNYNDRYQHYQRNGFQNDRKSTFYSDKENTNRPKNTTSSNNIAIDDNLAFYKDTYLSKTEFTEVEILVSLGNNEYWIYKPEDTAARIDLTTKLQDIAERSCNVQPIIGEIYGVQHRALWCRAMITSLNPVKVHFIDFGNDEILNNGADIKDIQHMSKVPKFARKIRLTQDTSERHKNLQCGGRIFVRMLFMDAEKTMEIEIQEQFKSSPPRTMESASSMNNVEKIVQVNSKALPNKSTKNSTIQTPSFLDALADLLAQKEITELEVVGLIHIIDPVQKNTYSASICPDVHCNEIDMIFHDLQVECAKIQESMNCKPPLEDLVCGKWKVDGWYRGYVSICPASSDLHILLVDEARIVSVDEIIPCPTKYLNICTFGVTCEVTHPTIELQVGEVYKFKAFMNERSHKQQSLKVEITLNKNKDDSEVITAVVKPWMNITNLTKTLSIKSGSKICLTSYRNHFCMFARSLEEAEIEYYNNIMQRVAQCARTAPYLSKPPNIGQIVIAPFCDGNSYRALVIETQNDKAKIIYIDFGNVEEKSNINELQVLPDFLALQRSCCTKIFLKDVPRDIPMNKEADLYLRNLIGKEIPLTCMYENAPFKDGVHLTMLTGENINNNINQLLIPDWKKNDYNDKTCYMLDDIEFASLGCVNDIINVIVLVIKENGIKYIMSPYDIDLVTHIETMPAMFKEYCEKMEYYIPRVGELCLALYDGDWFRAVCLDPRQSNTTSEIFFIDYGNTETIEHKNIRLMSKDFIVPDAMANVCSVVNLAPVDETGNYSSAIQQVLTELVHENSIIKIKIVSSGNGDYKIELPEIRAALIKKGLVQSSDLK